MIKKQDPELDFFKETFLLLNSDLKTYKYRLQHKNFDQAERKLLNAFLSYRKGDKTKVFELLKHDSFSKPFYEATRFYLLGITQNHFGTYAFAIPNLEKAVEIYREIKEELFVLFPLTSLVLTLGNQRKLKEMAIYADMLDDYAPEKPHNQLLVLHAKAVYFLISGQLTKAEQVTKIALKKETAALEIFKAGFLMILFQIAFQQKNYKLCYSRLEDYKDNNGFKVKASYQYMKTLLDHIVNRSPIYAYASDYQEYPELYHQIEVIKALSKADVTEAKRFWSILDKHNPALYQKDFTYKGDTGLFSEALALYRGHANTADIDYAKLNNLDSPMEKLEYIFSIHAAPISKADLIQLIWDEEVSEVAMGRLRKLIFSYRKNKGKDVVSYQDTYQLKKTA